MIKTAHLFYFYDFYFLEIGLEKSYNYCARLHDTYCVK